MDPDVIFIPEDFWRSPTPNPTRDKDLMQWLENTDTIYDSTSKKESPQLIDFDELDRIAMEIWDVPPTPSTLYQRGTKKRTPKEIKDVLRLWIQNSTNCPYPSVNEKTCIAGVVCLSFEQVTTFCRNYRKRFCKVSGKDVSYTQHGASHKWPVGSRR